MNSYYSNLPSRRMWEGSPCDKFSLSLAMLSLSAVIFWFILLDGDPCREQQKKKNKFKDNMFYFVLMVMYSI